MSWFSRLFSRSGIHVYENWRAFLSSVSWRRREFSKEPRFFTSIIIITATILSIGQSNNKEFFCNKKFGKRDFLCLFCLPTHSICFMKSCHFRKTGEQGKLKEKRDHRLNMEIYFQWNAIFWWVKLARKQINHKLFLLKIYYF